MKLPEGEESVVLVVGASLAAGKRDHPLAERLRAEIDRRGMGHHWRRGVVVWDHQYFASEALMRSTTIAIGGPGSNAAAAAFVNELSTIYSQADRCWVQADDDGESGPRRYALWGVDGAATAEAVTAFIDQGFLDDLLNRLWRVRPGLVM